MTALIGTQELSQRLNSTGLKIIDASWHMPAENSDARKEYSEAHIPGAVFFDIDAVCDKSSPYPHMLPEDGQFAEAMGALGVGDEDEIVVYDGNGLFSAARLWWMLRYFGHENVRVLDGGLPKWTAEGRVLQMEKPIVILKEFTVKPRAELLRSMREVEDAVAGRTEYIVDARSHARFHGDEPEPRPGVRSGHIPGSLNVYYKDCLSPPYQTVKPIEDLREIFAGRGVNISMPIIASCGSGVTACILALALYELGNTTVAVYDGSWAEWGSRKP